MKKFLVQEQLLSNFECPICFDVLENPQIINGCAHTFCQNCLKSLGKARIKKCPICKRGFRKITKNYSLANIIDNLPVECTRPRCHWRGLNLNYQGHLSDHDSQRSPPVMEHNLGKRRSS